ncbi:MAG: hypothetical protein DRO65_03985 [Candidatus Altiarchaeales archaeon]|nr:MAG: hypothetical protein DRO65_03985 [Candidatus Altiarchaeales archaeon]
MMNKKASLILAFFIFMLLISIASSEDILVKKCSIKLDDVRVAKFGPDKIFIAEKDKIHVFDYYENACKEVKTVNLSSSYTISDLIFYDIDKDKADEIIIAVGWIEDIEVNESYFNISQTEGKEKITMRTKILKRIIRDNGSLLIYDDEKIEKLADLGSWPRKISIGDANEDGKKEIIVKVEGISTKYYREYVNESYSRRYCVFINYNPVYDVNTLSECKEACGGKVLGYPQDYSNCYCDLDQKGCKCFNADNKTCKYWVAWEENRNCIWSGKRGISMIVYLYKEGEGWKPYTVTIDPYKCVRPNRWYCGRTICDRVEWKTTVEKEPKNKIFVLNFEGNILERYNTNTTPFRDFTNLYILDLEKDGKDETILGYNEENVGKISVGWSFGKLINESAEFFWEYRLPLEESLISIVIKNLSVDTALNFIILSDKSLKILDYKEESLKAEIPLQNFVEGFINPKSIDVGDVDNDDYDDFLILHENSVDIFEISPIFKESIKAWKLYNDAKDIMLSNSSLAISLANEAMKIFEKINDTSGVKDCMKLIEKIKTQLFKDKKREADKYYAKAFIYMNSDPKKALYYAEKAKEIFEEINNTEALASVSKLIEELKEKLERKESTTTSTATTMASTETTKAKKSQENLAIFVIVGILAIIILTAILLFLKKGKAKILEEEKSRQEFTKKGEEEEL